MLLCITQGFTSDAEISFFISDLYICRVYVHIYVQKLDQTWHVSPDLSLYP